MILFSNMTNIKDIKLGDPTIIDWSINKISYKNVNLKWSGKIDSIKL